MGLGDLQNKVKAFDKDKKLADLKKQATDSAALSQTVTGKLGEVNAAKGKFGDPLAAPLEAELDKAHQQLTIAKAALNDAKAAQAGIAPAVADASLKVADVKAEKDAGKTSGEVFKKSIELGKSGTKVRTSTVTTADSMVAAAEAAKKANEAAQKAGQIAVGGARPNPDPAMTALNAQVASTGNALTAVDQPIKDAKSEADKTSFKAAMKKPGNVVKTPDELLKEAQDFEAQANAAKAAIGDTAAGPLKDLEDAVNAAEKSLADARTVASDFGATSDDRAKAARDAVQASKAAQEAADKAKTACDEACKAVQELDDLAKEALAVIAAAEAAKNAAKLDDAQKALAAAEAAQKRLADEAAQKAAALEAKKAQALEARRKAEEAVAAAKKALDALKASKAKPAKPPASTACGEAIPEVPQKESSDLTNAIKALADLQKMVDALAKELAALEEQAKQAAEKLPSLQSALDGAKKKFDEAEAERSAADKLKDELADARKELDAARKAVCDEATKAKEDAEKAKKAKDEVVDKRIAELRNEGHGPQRHLDPNQQAIDSRALHKTNPERMKPGTAAVRNEHDPPDTGLHQASDEATKFKNADDYVVADANARDYFRAHGGDPKGVVPYPDALPGVTPGSAVEGSRLKAGSAVKTDLPLKGGGRSANPDYDNIDQAQLNAETTADTEPIPGADFQKGVFAYYEDVNGKFKMKTMYPMTN